MRDEGFLALSPTRRRTGRPRTGSSSSAACTRTVAGSNGMTSEARTLVPTCCRSGKRQRAEQPRRHVRGRSWGTAGRRRSLYAGTDAPPHREHAHGQVNLGIMYATGRGVPRDDAEAARWYRRAAEQKHADAQFKLARMYATGRGVPRDDAEAARWYRRAAEQKHADAQNNLGIMYANGRGGPARRRRSRTLVPTRRRTGRCPWAAQPRHHVRERSGGPARRRRSRTLVPHGGRPGTRRRAGQPRLHARARSRRAAGGGRSRALGTDAPPNREIPTGSSTSAACTRTVAGSSATTLEPYAGTAWRQTRGMNAHRGTSNVFNPRPHPPTPSKPLRGDTTT